jgi:hypothetical protein
MRRCTTCDSYEPNPRCPACQPKIEEPEYAQNFGGYDDDDVGPEWEDETQ